MPGEPSLNNDKWSFNKRNSVADLLGHLFPFWYTTVDKSRFSSKSADVFLVPDFIPDVYDSQKNEKGKRLNR